MSMFRKVLYISSFGYISYFFSERIFWSFFRPFPEDTFSSFLITWFIYSMLSYLVLGLIWRYRVTDWKRLFLVGAIYGWVAEGSVATTMYGTTMGIWATISFTALAWHALCTVLFGWLFILSGIHAKISIKRFISMLFIFGLLSAFWALSWVYEGNGWDVTPDAFSMHVWVYALPLPIAYILVGKFTKVPFVLSRTEWWLLMAIFGGLYIFWNITTAIFPFSLILPPLLLLSIMGLKRSASKGADSPTTLLWGGGGSVILRSILIFILPLTATLAYPVLYNVFGALHTNWFVFMVTMPLGYILYAYVIFGAFRSKIK